MKEYRKKRHDRIWNVFFPTPIDFVQPMFKFRLKMAGKYANKWFD